MYVSAWVKVFDVGVEVVLYMCDSGAVMGKHPDLMVGPPTPTIFPTIGRNYEISFFFRKKFRKGVHQNID